MNDGGDFLPLVSVIAICFNHERYVVECLESIRAQTHPNVQLIIADDCSTDRSVSLIREWVRRTGTPCTLILHDENRGICRTRNEAHSHAEGTYVAGISTDDVWLPHRLAAQVEQLERLPSTVGVAYGDAFRIDDEGRPLVNTFIEALGTVAHPPEGDVYEELLDRNFIPAGSTLVRRECFARVGLYDESLSFEDKDMWLRIAREYEFVFTPAIGTKYRVHPESLSHALDRRHGGTLWWESNMAIFLKHLGHSSHWDAILWERIARAAYRLDRPERLEYARANLRANRDVAALVLYTLCRARIPYRRVARAKRLLNRLLATARQTIYAGPLSALAPTDTPL